MSEDHLKVSKYNEILIYYFSGTANAKNAANWIKNIAIRKGIKTTLYNIEIPEEVQYPKSDEKILIGFCSPTHGFNLPPLFLKFISQFPRSKNADAFILNTRGGLKLSKLFLPGLSGLAQIFPALVLKRKGYHIVGMQPLDLPSNWLFLHPGLRKSVINSIYERCKNITENFSLQIISGRKKYKALWSLPFDIAVLPISLGYYFVGRFFLAKTLMASTACNHCGLCAEHCPVHAIKMTENGPYWTFKCESCMRCVNLCPQRAIQTTHGFILLNILLVYTFLLPMIVLLLGLTGISYNEGGGHLGNYLRFLFESGLLVITLFFSYKFVRYFIKLRCSFSYLF